MWDWIVETVQMLIDGLSLLLSGGLRLALMAALCVFLYALFRWFKDEPVKFIRQWTGFFVGVVIFFGAPYLLGKHLAEQIDRHDWIPIALYIASAYIAYKAWALIGGFTHEHGDACESKDRASESP